MNSTFLFLIETQKQHKSAAKNEKAAEKVMQK